MRCLLAVLFLVSVGPGRAVAWDNLAVLPAETEAGPTDRMMSRYLKQLAYQAFERRRAAYEEMDTPEELAAYQDRIRAELVERLGGFPERTPLNARVVGRIDADGYRIEKVIYESRPRHYVTACLYMPKGEPPFPGVVVPSGHSATAKAANYNQRVAILLAKHGIAALCYDPIGQGERSQLLDDEGRPRFKSTTEHTLIGASCIPLGLNTATYRIWDGIRSIDYLASREEVDPERIGVTGCSGGGTLSSYLMAIDRRVACAAPSCYLTSFRRLIDTIGPQDAEQNIFGQIAAGIDHADYVMVRAPKPTIMLVSTRDFFDIDGAWDTFRQAKRFYTRLGYPERVSLIETDARHGYPKTQREAMLRWMRRWLAGVDEPATEPEFETRDLADLLCTPNGQTLLMDGARSVVDLNVNLNESLAEKRRELWRPENRDEALAAVRRIAKIRTLDALPQPKVTSIGTLERDGYEIEKLVLRTEPGIVLPALMFRPSTPAAESRRAGFNPPHGPVKTGSTSGRDAVGVRYLYLHGDGKQADAQPGGPIEKLVKAGHRVLAVDVRGIGETGTGGDNLWGGNWDEIFLTYLLGKSLVGMRAEDVLVSARFLSAEGIDGQPAAINVVAVGHAGPPALHAVALEPELFGTLTLKRSLRSFSDVVRNPAAGGQLANVVHGALRAYDLPDLINALPVNRVTTIEPVTLQDR